MADPIKILNRLEQLSTRHAVFEPDQVLTHHQLNSVWEYLDDQARLTHVNLQGVGVVAGLRVALGSAMTAERDWVTARVAGNPTLQTALSIAGDASFDDIPTSIADLRSDNES